jgi:23S rRNA pseudouridine2605 synthase
MTEKLRLQKWLSELGIASRRQAETWITEGRLTVNGELAKLGVKVDPQNDQISLNGKPIKNDMPPRVYWLLNKPDQVLTSSKDSFDRQTIYDLPRLKGLKFKVDPVGRLDYRTEGLLLLTNDGELLSRFTHPKYEIPRHYQALVSGRLTDEELEKVRAGIKLEDGKTGPVQIDYANAQNLGASTGCWYLVTIKEGSNRHVRGLFEHYGLKVVRLIRYGIGSLRLDESLPPGEYRQLNSEEIAELKASVDLR